MKAKYIVTLVCSLVSLFQLPAGQSEKDKRPRYASREEMVNHRFGGYVKKPQTLNGRFYLVDSQKRVAFDYSDQLKIISDVFYVDFSRVTFDGQIGIDNAKSALEKVGAKAAVFIVDRPDYPTVLIAPESGYGFINVAALAADDPGAALLSHRLRREVWRAFAMVAGSPNTEWQQCLLGSITSLKDLDLINSEAVSPEPAKKIARHLAKLGIPQNKRITYLQACREGWAPAPTNDVQKAIWDKVHAMPTEPLKIKPETKKVAE